MLHQASRIAASDGRSPLALALASEGLSVEQRPASSAADLLGLAADDDLVWLAADDGDDELIRQVATQVVQRAERGEAGTEVEVVVGAFDPAGSRLLDLVEVMDRLRRECPWDREQTHASLVRYLVEETYETVEAIETGDRDHLREELGDLLLQVMFHARLAQEHDDEPFDIDDVAAGIVEKMIRRHPHVFAADRAAEQPPEGPSAGSVQTAWEDIKATEKARASRMDGIAPGLPALSLAGTVVHRASRAAGPTGEAGPTGPAPTDAPAYTEQALGDALFALVAAGQAAGLDAERALRLRVRQEIAHVRGQEQRATQRAPLEPG
ncbi:MAG: MazG family protein [Propionibacteriales bacterium]|nr:MazG family protein [Propionibacteriales bacterium]